jgi:PAS domain S-box-containing protein
MMEEWKTKGKLLQELDSLRSRVAQLERAEHKELDRESEGLAQRLRRIFNNATEGILLSDLKSKEFVLGNKAVCQMLGYNVEDTSNLAMMNICPPEETNHLIEQFEKQVSGELVFRKDVPFRRKDGGLFYADIISVPLTFSDNVYLLCFLRETPFRKDKAVLQQRTSLDSYSSRLLTETEIKVLKSIVKGMSNKEIARLFHRSVRTIENHRAHIMKKLSVDSSVELIRRAVALGLVDLPMEQDEEKQPEY